MNPRLLMPFKNRLMSGETNMMRTYVVANHHAPPVTGRQIMAVRFFTNSFMGRPKSIIPKTSVLFVNLRYEKTMKKMTVSVKA